MTVHSYTDEQIIQGIVAQDRGAFNLAFAQLSQSVFKTCYAILLDQQEAEDAMQDSFVKLWNNASSWHGDASLKTWVLKIAKNRCLDMLRKRKSESKKQQDFYAEQLTQDTSDAPVGTDNLEHADDQKRLQKVLFSLPERQREAITLVYYNELRNSEAAKMMDMNVGAFDSLVARARRNMAKNLQEGMREE